jgi:hypothetical protein
VSINEVPKMPGTTMTAVPVERMKMNGLEQSQKVADSPTDKGMMKLLRMYPGGEADGATLANHRIRIIDLAKRMRAKGLDVSKYNIPGLDE